MQLENPRKLAYLLPSLYLAWIFIEHGTRAVGQQASFVELGTNIGFSFSLSSTVVLIVGIIDITIGILLIFRPSKFVWLYAGFWVFVPATLSYIAGRHGIVYEIWHALLPLIMAGLAWFLYSRFTKYPRTI